MCEKEMPRKERQIKTAIHVMIKSAALVLGLFSGQVAMASGFGSTTAEAPLYPISPMIVQKGVQTIYPSVAGGFLVYSTSDGDTYRVVRVSKYSPESSSRELKPMALHEAIRFGVAVNDGSIGYVSSRTGPIAAWMWMGNGESHAALGHLGSFSGNVVPYHLKASYDGKVWCYDTSLQKIRQNVMLNEFVKSTHTELEGQAWRTYDSDSFRHKSGYKATETGKTNDFNAPVLYVFNRMTMQLNMIPNAFDGSISPDGKHVVFTRESKGNYDLWMQTIDGEELVQLTDSKFGDFEPQFSPDGNKLLFVSNRAYDGKVTKTSIYMMDLKSFKITRLTNAKGAVDGGPAWLDDGHIVFHSNRSLKAPQAKTGSDWNIWQLQLSQQDAVQESNKK